MKIVAIGRNYTDHIRELANETPEEPVIFMKPDTALLKDGATFYMPDFDANVHYEAELVYRICREGRFIERRFANRYYDAVTVGVDFTARELQARLKEKSLPWELSKAFDGSAAVGTFAEIPAITEKLEFSFYQNGSLKQQAASTEMIYNIDQIIEFVSRYITLKKGDLIFTGTPAGVGPVVPGDELTGVLNSTTVLKFKVA